MIDIEDLSFPIDEYKVMQLSATSSSVDRIHFPLHSIKELRRYVDDSVYVLHDLEGMNTYRDSIALTDLLNQLIIAMDSCKSSIVEVWLFFQDSSNVEYYCRVDDKEYQIFNKMPKELTHLILKSQ